MARRKPMNEKLRKEAQKMYEKFVKVLNSKFTALQVELTEKRDADCIILHGEKIIAYAELEWAERWKTHEFPYPSVHFPKAKEKYAKSEIPVFMITFNKDITNALIVDAKTMAESPVVEIRTRARRYITYGEPFHDVPLEKVVLGINNLENYIMERLGIKT